MKKLTLIGFVVGLAVFSVTYFKGMDKRAFVNGSCQRVEVMFEDLKFDDSGHESEAGGLWYKGSPQPLNDRVLYDAFYQFLRKGGIWMGQVKTYEFVSSRLINGEDVVGRFVEVRCKVNGENRMVIVRHKLPLEWGK
jgi:hypothetical protein